MLHLILMVVANFNIIGVTINKPKADAPLVVNGDGMLAFSVSF